MSQEQARKSGTIGFQEQQPGQHGMVNKERWEQIRRLYCQEHVTVSDIARRPDVIARPDATAHGRGNGTAMSARRQSKRCCRRTSRGCVSAPRR